MKVTVDQWTSMFHSLVKKLIDNTGLLPQDFDFDTEELCDTLGYFCEYEDDEEYHEWSPKIIM